MALRLGCEWRRGGGSNSASEPLVVPPARSLADGLPGRPWYRHVLQAPGLYTGYAARTLPGIDDAITARNWSAVDAQAAVVAQRVAAAARFLVGHEEPIPASTSPPNAPERRVVADAGVNLSFVFQRVVDLFLFVLVAGAGVVVWRRCCSKRTGGGALQLPPELAMTASRPMS